MFNFIGCGSCFNPELGNTSAYTIIKDTLVLMDCGEDVFGKLIKRGILNKDLKKIYVFITHMHSDHVGSLPSFIFYCNYVLKRNVNIIYPRKQQMQEWLDLSDVDKHMYNILNCDSTDADDYQGEIIVKTYEIKDDDNKLLLQFKPLNVHHRGYRDAYAYHIREMDTFNAYIYTGDVKEWPFGYYVTQILDEIKQLYIDVSLWETPVHLNINTLIEKVPSKYRNKITCMHFDSKETIELAIKEGFNVPNMVKEGVC